MAVKKKKTVTKKPAAKKKTGAKAAFGGYAICFKGCANTLESVFGDKPIGPSQMTKLLWAFIKGKKLAGK